MNNFKKQCEDIQVPENIDFILSKAMKKGRNTMITRRFITSIIIICVLLTSLFGTCYAYPEVAEKLTKIPFVGSMFKVFTDNDLRSASDKGLTNISIQEQTKDGVTVAIKEIYYDRAQFSIGIAVKGATPGNDETFFEVYYNGERITSGSSGGGSTPISNDLFYRILTMHLEKPLPDKCNVKLIGTDSYGLPKFVFDIPIDCSKVDPLSKEITLMQTFKDKDRTILIKNIIFTPGATTINYEYTHPKGERYRMMLMYENNIELRSKGGSSTIIATNGDYDTVSGTYSSQSSTIPEYLTLNIIDNQQSVVLDLDYENHILMSMKLQLK